MCFTGKLRIPFVSMIRTSFRVSINHKKLLGHVGNTSYPQIKVNIELNITIPYNATGPVTLIMEFGFVLPPGIARPAASTATSFHKVETPLGDCDIAFRQHAGGHTPGPN